VESSLCIRKHASVIIGMLVAVIEEPATAKMNRKK
jgi:hypothetical protein